MSRRPNERAAAADRVCMKDLRRSAMANPERDASTAAHTATHEAKPDTRTLVALLEGLMPLLLRIQEQSLGQQPFPFSLLDPANLTAQNAMLDHQAAVSLVEDITADSLR